MDVTKTCLLCGLDFGDGDFVTVSRGLDTLRPCSDEKRDGLRATMDLHRDTVQRVLLNISPAAPPAPAGQCNAHRQAGTVLDTTPAVS